MKYIPKDTQAPVERSMDTKALGDMFDAHKDDDITRREGQEVPTEQLTSRKLVEENLLLFAEALHHQQSESAARLVYVIADALKALPRLDKKLWPVILETYRSNTGEMLPVRDQVIVSEDPMCGFEQLKAAHPREMASLEKMSLMPWLRKLAGTSYIKPLLLLLALQGACREVNREKNGVGVIHEQVATGDKTSFATLIDALETDTIVVGVGVTPEKKEKDVYETKAALFASLAAATSFDRKALGARIAQSVAHESASWGIAIDSVDPDPDIIADMTEFYEKRLWDAIGMIAGQYETANEHIVFSDRKITGRAGVGELVKTHTFTLSEQEEVFGAWLAKEEMGKTVRAIENLDAFAEAQPEGPGAIAYALDAAVPAGFLVATSGFRSREDQVKTIIQLAKEHDVDLSTYDMSDGEDINAAVAELQTKGVLVASPDTSMHVQNSAVDFAMPENFSPSAWKLSHELARLVIQHVKKNPHLSRALEEQKNGKHGVIHVEGKKKFLEQAGVFLTEVKGGNGGSFSQSVILLPWKNQRSLD